ncbi:tail fiber domain-containing protein [Luteolibacter yonseiensis]|uniref:Tail fiber domain-containing protein n=1 Tax=Luteolibacter yonseiensis TaxID=1144680 RepID=A0A934V8N3_9BACT|nr:tail fiber domain-containing protein [Luteolibacter yonseiensis]MBK1814298.1 tail fiber domain-containing protein [Luteolibacter yonseiensis]
MKTRLFTLSSLLGITAGQMHAQTVPPYINYQGKLTDSAGVGLGTGTPVNRKVIFRIFDAPTGGNRLWSEQHTVTLSGGEFSVLLGNGIDAVYNSATENPSKTNTPLDTVFTTAGVGRYVEIVVDNGDTILNTSDAAIAPRQQITTTAYSFRARAADMIASGTDLQLNNNSNYGLGYYGATRPFNTIAVDGPVLFGLSGGALGSVNGATRNIALRWNATGAVGIGGELNGAAATTRLVLQGDDSNTVPAQLNIRGNSDTNKRLLIGYNTSSNYSSLQSYAGASSASNLVLNSGGGNVGIGTISPGSRLTVVGNTEIQGGISATGANGAGYTFNGGGDGDGGLFSPEDGTITIRTNSTEKVRVTWDGNMGVGTSNPTSRLQVNGGITATYGSVNHVQGIHLEWNKNGAGESWILNQKGLGTGGIAFGEVSSANAVTERMRIAANGNVGIGSNNPGSRLTIQADNPRMVIQAEANTNKQLGIGFNPTDNYGYIEAVEQNVAWRNLVLCGSGGNVGIGTTNPNHRLTVSGNVSATGYTFSANDVDGGIYSPADGTMTFWTDNVEKMRIMPNGNVGIGTTNPLAGLEINRKPYVTITRLGRIANGGYNDDDQTSAWETSIRASGAIAGEYFVVQSDERIKKIQGVSNGAEDLRTLQGIHITNYTMRELPEGRANPVQKKVVAQQVEAVYPPAVKKGMGTIPDILEMAKCEDGWIDMKTDLKKGEKVRLVTAEKDAVHEVLEVSAGGRKFRADVDSKNGEVLVYGREVKDFRTVDYDALSMLNISATQQIKKEKDKEIQDLKAENDGLRARLAALETKDQERDARLSAIESSLGSGEGKLRTVSHETGAE